MSANLMIVADLVLGVFFIFVFKKLVSHRPFPLPPGPKGYPLIGNVFDLPSPKEKDWIHWQKFKKLYGPISSVKAFGRTIVLLHDYNIAVDLLEKTSNLFSDRPRFIFGGEMCGWDSGVVLARYGKRFRQYRRYLHQFLGTRSSLESIAPLLQVESRRFLNRTLGNSDTLYNEIRRLAGAIILRLTYGYTIEREGSDYLVTLADEVVRESMLSLEPGAWIVDVLPFLRYVPEWFPGASFKRVARNWSAHGREFVDRPYAFVKHQMALGATVLTSFTSTILASQANEPTGEDEHCIKWAASAIYGGGADTTVSALYTFFLAMVLNPDVQRLAQEEIDRVIGSERLPNISDRAQLPYVNAVLKECLRWGVVAPMGLPHAPVEDYVYKDHIIPKGTIVMVNLWDLARDPKYYNDPDKFNPSRFLKNTKHEPELDPREFVFGFGRRICPGKELADMSMWLTIVGAFACLNISKLRDDLGIEITPPVEYDNGPICHPIPFPCSITPRSDKALTLVQSVEVEHPYEESDSKKLAHIRW